MIKSEATTGSLWEAQNITVKKDYFTKILSSPRFFEINTSNFQEMFLGMFKKFCQKEFFFNKKQFTKLFFFIFFFLINYYFLIETTAKYRIVAWKILNH